MRVNVLTSGAGGIAEKAMTHRLTSFVGWAAASLIGWQMVSAAGPAHPVKLSPNEAATVLKDIEKDRADTQKWLQSDPTSYLATVDRRDFEQKKTLSVGRAADNGVRIDDPAVAAHHVKV